MPMRSFIGVWILVGMIAGAVVGLNFGNLGPSLIIGMVAGLAIGWLIDRVKGVAGSGGGSGDGGANYVPGDAGHHSHGHHADGGSHGGGAGDGGGGDGGGGGD